MSAKLDGFGVRLLLADLCLSRLAEIDPKQPLTIGCYRSIKSHWLIGSALYITANP